MKLIIILLFITNTAFSQLSIFGGFSCAPRIEVTQVNKYSVLPAFVATIGDSKTAVNFQIGNISKIGLICSKGIFKASFNYCIDLFYKEKVQHIAELEIGVFFKLPKSNDLFLSITSILGVNLKTWDSSYCPLNVAIYKPLYQKK